jgi:hypothetical protein
MDRRATTTWRLAALTMLLVLVGAAALQPAGAVTREAYMDSTARDSLDLVVEVPERVGAGEAVPIRLVVENASGDAVTLYLTGRPIAFDVEVTDASGEVVWRRLEGQVASMVLQIRELAAGERLVFEAVWDQRTSAGRLVPPGAYRVRGVLPTDAREPLMTPYADLRIGEG